LSPLIDAHTHLDACGAKDADDVHALVDRAAAVGVTAVVTIADDLASARWATQAAEWDPRVYAAVALHPTRADALTDAARAEIERLAAEAGVPVGALITRGNDNFVAAVDDSGVAPLHRAVRTRCAAAVETLLRGGADAKLKNKNGSTPMMLARMNTGRGGSGSIEARAQQQEIVILLRNCKS